MAADRNYSAPLDWPSSTMYCDKCESWTTFSRKTGLAAIVPCSFCETCGKAYGKGNEEACEKLMGDFMFPPRTTPLSKEPAEEIRIEIDAETYKRIFDTDYLPETETVVICDL